MNILSFQAYFFTFFHLIDLHHSKKENFDIRKYLLDNKYLSYCI